MKTRTSLMTPNPCRKASLWLAATLVLGALGCARTDDLDGGLEHPESAKKPLSPGETLGDPPAPPEAPPNPLLHARLFVDPESLSMLQTKALEKTAPTKAEVLARIAQEPQALWLGGWNTNVFRAAEHFVGRARAAGEVPVMVAYNIPLRDCGQHSKGGLRTLAEYQRWVSDLARGIGDDPAVVILEPDALGHFQECLTAEQKTERLEALRYGVRVLRTSKNTAVYLDAGHPRWVPADEMAKRLRDAGVESANGFSLNTSNYVSTDENLAYGRKLSALLDGKHFVIDTSRNGAGPYEEAKTPEEQWCNPPGRKIGVAPTTNTGEPLCDGFLWLKRPGESDGECAGGPRAGVWWEAQALELARR